MKQENFISTGDKGKGLALVRLLIFTLVGSLVSSCASESEKSEFLVCKTPFFSLTINSKTSQAWWDDKETQLVSFKGDLTSGSIEVLNLSGRPTTYTLNDASIIHDGTKAGRCEYKAKRDRS